jgi:hypothetical protein
MSVFHTSHQGCASTLRFILGDAAHLRTYRRDDGKITFEFENSDRKANEIAALFFSEEGIAVGDARQLLESDRAVRKTVSECIRSTDLSGEWKNEL